MGSNGIVGDDKMKDILEAVMVVCFGLSWPISIVKSYKTRSTKGKSIFFLSFILAGYAFGILSKVVGQTINYVFIFYCINFFMVFLDIMLYLRNRQFDLLQQKERFQ